MSETTTVHGRSGATRLARPSRKAHKQGATNLPRKPRCDDLEGRDRQPSEERLTICVQTRPVFCRTWWTKPVRARSLRLDRSCAIERCIRRVQFKFAFVPGTLKRYLRASKSVIMTMASHASLLKRAPMIAG